MGGSSASESDSYKEPEKPGDHATSVHKGRVAKKRGLSRHFPHKAQSFDCIASLGSAAAGSGVSALVLSKSLSRRNGGLRSSPSSPGLAGAMQVVPDIDVQHVMSSATIHECLLEGLCCPLEAELCSALQSQASLQSPVPPPRRPPATACASDARCEHVRQTSGNKSPVQVAR